MCVFKLFSEKKRFIKTNVFETTPLLYINIKHDKNIK